jgi:PadR family transcriptional regulator, regulatory protein PadR
MRKPTIDEATLLLTKDLVAASATPLVLSILAREESYGYAILQRVRELSGGKMGWTDGMLYPVLHRLEERKLIVAHWHESETGRKRRYYRLSAAGKAELESQREQWSVVVGTLGKLWGAIPCST